MGDYRLRTRGVPTLPSRGRPTVSVVIPCHNYARFLPQAVESVLSQACVEVDVVIVDDASTDASLDTAQRLASGHGRVAVLANGRNLGPVETFNRGLAQARGEFVVRLDADDLLTPGALQRAVAVLQAHPSVGLVYGHPIHFSGTELPRPRTDVGGWLVWSGIDWLEARCRDGANVITSPEVLMRRSVLDVVGGQKPLAHTHDMELWLRIAAFSDVAYIVGADQAWHREHPASLSRAAGDPLVILAEIRMAFDTLFDGLGALTAEQSAHRRDSRRAIAVAAVSTLLNDVDRGAESADHAALRQFALDTDPTVVATPEWRRLTQAAPGPTARGQLRRARGRIRQERRQHRWRNTGVYERLLVIPQEAVG
jgi:GT2 family glycosyltransferase